MTVTTVASAAALNAALKSAQAGDTVLLAPGTYSAVAANGLTFATAVTVASADPANPAVITSMTLSGSAGLTFRSLDLRVDYAGGENPFQILSSKLIRLEDSQIHGSLDGNPGNDRAALLVRDSQDVTVTGSNFRDLYIGVSHLNNARLTIENNTFADIRMDGIRGAGSSWVTIRGNQFTDFQPATGDHADAIQFWTTGTATPAHDIVISGNLLTRGDGSPAVQGIFFGDEARIPPERVTIEGNLVAGLSYNSLAVYGGKDVTIRDNVVLSFPDAKAWIRLTRVDGATVDANETTYVVVTESTGIVQTNTTTVPPVTDEGRAEIDAWLAAHGLALPAWAGSPTADTLGGTSGADTLAGGFGDDVYVVNHVNDVVVEAAGAGDDLVKASVTHTLGGNVENLLLTGSGALKGTGNIQDNVITGNVANNVLTGLDGDDKLNGMDGADTLIGGAGADKLVGGPGADRMEGGAGDDYYVVDNIGDVVVEAAGAGRDHVVATISYRMPANVERLTLSDGALNGTGNELANSMRGGEGDNSLSGLAGADTLQGNGGADTLNGGAGADMLTGGAGADRFVLQKGQAAGDVITDFAAGDKLELSGWSPGSTVALQAGSATTWLIRNAADGAVETIQLSNAYKLAVGDWIFT